MLFKYPISDCHIHVFNHRDIDDVMKMVDFCGYTNWASLALCSIPFKPQNMPANLVAALCKLKDPRCHAFGSFHYNPDGTLPDADELLRQIKWLYDAGFDGVKMLDGKPGFRKKLGNPLDDPRYDKMFDWCEKQQFPIMYHINDPMEFWHWEMLPEWAKEKNNFYGDGTFPRKLTIDEETFGFLRKHPGLNICIPHFFFISDQYGLCCEMLDRYPNLYFDITPGWEMYENFAKDVGLWKHFFSKYSHKILFGSDTYSDHWMETVTCMQRALETTEEFEAFEEHVIGLDLDEETLRQIYYRNYYKFIGYPGKKMNIPALIEYSKSITSYLPREEDKPMVQALVDEIIEEIRKFA